MSKEKEILVRLCKEIEELNHKVSKNDEGRHWLVTVVESMAVDIDNLKRNITMLENHVHELRLQSGVKNDLEDN